MISFSKAIVSTAALLALIQYCPAPVLLAEGAALLIPGIGEAASASIAAAGDIAAGAGEAVGSAAEGAGEAAAGSVKRYIERDVSARDFSSHIKRMNASESTKLAWPSCHDQLQQSTLKFQAAGPGSIIVSGIPPACMTFSATLTGEFAEGKPVPMSSDSIQFNNLSKQNLNRITQALKARA